ncbi:MAG: transglutaminase-like domain-containing protein [Candidatus Woesearchaeota archaeon]
MSLKFEYHFLELIKSDETLFRDFGAELVKESPNLSRLEEIIETTRKMDSTVARRKVQHAIRKQVQSAQEVFREIAVQNIRDAYAEYVNLLTRREQQVEYPLKAEVGFQKRHQEEGKEDPEHPQYDVTIRDFAIGMSLYDVLFKLLTIGDDVKKEKKFLVGGHGRGFKPCINFCEEALIDSFGKRTRLLKEKKGEEEEYYIEIGERSEVQEGTTITLRGLEMEENPLQVVSRYASSLTENYDFRVNGIKVNRATDPNKLGRLTWVQSHQMKDGSSLEDSLTACSPEIEGVEVQQGGMTLTRLPPQNGLVRRVLNVPTKYLFSRSRNELPKPVEEAVNQDVPGLFQRFYSYLRDNFQKIGGYEFAFMEQFSLKKSVGGKWFPSLRKHLTRAGKAALIGLASVSLVTYLIIPACKEIDFQGSSKTYSTSSNQNFPSHFVPKVDVGYALDLQEEKKLPYDCQNGQCRGSQNVLDEFYKDTSHMDKMKSRVPIGIYEPPKSVFFRVTSYNRLEYDGSWSNWGSSNTAIVSADKSRDELRVTLNLNLGRNSLLPLPIGYYIDKDKILFPEQGNLNFAKPDEGCDGIESRPEDSYCANVDSWAKDENKKRITLVATPIIGSNGGLENQIIDFQENKDWIGDPRKDGEKGRLRDRSGPTKSNDSYTNVPFLIKYPPVLEDRLRKIDELARQQEKARGKFDDDEISKRVEEELQWFFVYNTSRKNAYRFYGAENFVNYALKLRNVDCDVANSAYCAIVRDRYQIPSRLAVGYQGIEGVISADSGHAVCEVYLQDKGWTERDATPSSLSPEMIKVVRLSRESNSKLERMFYEWLSDQERQKQGYRFNIIHTSATDEVEHRHKMFQRGAPEEQEEEEYHGPNWFQRTSSYLNDLFHSEGSVEDLENKAKEEEAQAKKEEQREADKLRKEQSDYEKKYAKYKERYDEFLKEHSELSLEEADNLWREEEKKEIQGSLDSILNTISGGLLGFLALTFGGMFFALWRDYRREREELERFLNEPIVDVYVKHEKEWEEIKISINQATDMMRNNQLKYDHRLLRTSFADLNLETEAAIYVLDYSFYIMIAGKAGMQRKRSSEGGLELSLEYTPNPLLSRIIKDDQALGEKIPPERRKAQNGSIKDLRELVGDVYRANYGSLGDTQSINTDYQFKDSSKFFAVKRGTLYFNPDLELSSEVKEDPELIDTLIYAILTARNKPFSDFNKLKTSYLEYRLNQESTPHDH